MEKNQIGKGKGWHKEIPRHQRVALEAWAKKTAKNITKLSPIDPKKLIIATSKPFSGIKRHTIPKDEKKKFHLTNKKDIQNFIKNSNVKDTLYHGTTPKIKQLIDKDGFNQTTEGKGHWFFFDKKYADIYSHNNDKGIVKVKVDVNKIKEYEDYDSMRDEINLYDKKHGTKNYIMEDGLYSALKDNYDGYIFYRGGNRQKVLVVFDKNNIRTFDTNKYMK